MLIDEIRRRTTEAMRAGDATTKDILRLALGEIQTAEARGGAGGDEAAVAIVRRLVKSNQETLSLATDPSQRATLEKEIGVLESLLPKTLGVEAIVEALASSRDAIRAAGNDGQATGVAMKALKAAGANVSGKDVSEAVRRLRA